MIKLFTFLAKRLHHLQLLSTMHLDHRRFIESSNREIMGPPSDLAGVTSRRLGRVLRDRACGPDRPAPRPARHVRHPLVLGPIPSLAHRRPKHHRRLLLGGQRAVGP
ncbi:hypothetical protein V2J09_001724 [Rumex salicifolius]